jgi:hypothetical protein
LTAEKVAAREVEAREAAARGESHRFIPLERVLRWLKSGGRHDPRA